MVRLIRDQRLFQWLALTALVGAAPTGAFGLDNLLVNPGFEDTDPNQFTGSGSPYGDGWGQFGNVDYNSFWGVNGHASLFADWFDNVGYVWQEGIAGAADTTYQFDLLDTRIEASWDADLWFGMEYYAADNSTKLGESLVLIDAAERLANAQIDGNVFSMQGTAVAGTAFVRPIIWFNNVNSEYLSEPQANAFVFDTYLTVAPGPYEEHLKNPGFGDFNGDAAFGDYWGAFGNVDFNEFFGPDNPHVSFFADLIGNTGYVYQQAVLGTPGVEYQFDLVDVRIEDNFDADLYYGLEYYGSDDFAKIGETIVQADTSVPGDGMSYSMTGTAVPGTVYVRPIFFFDNVGSDGGTLRNAFVFETSLSEAALCAGDVDGDGGTALSDLAALLASYGLSLGDPGYNANADFDSNNTVDLGDLAFLLSDYGCGS